MKRRLFSLFVVIPIIVLLRMNRHSPHSSSLGPSARVHQSLPDARRGYSTHILKRETTSWAPVAPPASMFKLVHYDGPLGKMAAYIGQAPNDGKKHPAIIWLVGGFSNSISPVAWAKLPVDDDQSASAFRETGLIMMYPSLRGGNDNPGVIETCYGEVDDVIAAADFLARQPFVDPNRIYLGGHSTGGTLALLVAESTDKFRAVFAFGPIDDVKYYGSDSLPFDAGNTRETELRAPVLWLDWIKSPTFVIEGTGGNIEPLHELESSPHSASIQFYEISGATHFSTLAPLTRLIARKIMADSGPVTNIDFSQSELNQPFAHR